MAEQGADWKGWGFDSQETFDKAKALVEECAGFGLQAALGGRTPRVFDKAQAEAGPEFVDLPRAMLADVGAGPGGRLGRSILSAPARSQAPALARFDPPKAAVGSPADAGMWDMDAYESQGRPAARQAAPAPAPRRPPVEEGEGEDSFEAIISGLEANGFGNPETAELIRRNKAKASTRRH